MRKILPPEFQSRERYLPGLGSIIVSREPGQRLWVLQYLIGTSLWPAIFDSSPISVSWCWW